MDGADDQICTIFVGHAYIHVQKSLFQTVQIQNPSTLAVYVGSRFTLYAKEYRVVVKPN